MVESTATIHPMNIRFTMSTSRSNTNNQNFSTKREVWMERYGMRACLQIGSGGRMLGEIGKVDHPRTTHLSVCFVPPVVFRRSSFRPEETRLCNATLTCKQARKQREFPTTLRRTATWRHTHRTYTLRHTCLILHVRTLWLNSLTRLLVTFRYTFDRQDANQTYHQLEDQYMAAVLRVQAGQPLIHDLLSLAVVRRT